MSEHEYEKFTEKEEAIVDGVDISGIWNRMYEPRELTGYDLTFMDKVTETPGAESMGWCYQCAQCVGVCPVDNVGSYGPRKLFRKLQTGMNLFENDDLWLCTTCMNCLRVCPKEVNMMKIMPAIQGTGRFERESSGRNSGDAAECFGIRQSHGGVSEKAPALDEGT